LARLAVACLASLDVACLARLAVARLACLAVALFWLGQALLPSVHDLSSVAHNAPRTH
jgi:hypothetical protein